MWKSTGAASGRRKAPRLGSSSGISGRKRDLSLSINLSFSYSIFSAIAAMHADHAALAHRTKDNFREREKKIKMKKWKKG
jgi:hypothetical protein